jgi:hypothetical protein
MNLDLIHPLYQDTIYNAGQQPDTTSPIAEPPQTDDPITSDDDGGHTVPIFSVPIKPVPATLKPIPVQELSGQIVPVTKKAGREAWNSSGNFFTDNGLTGIVLGLKRQQADSSTPTYNVVTQPPGILLQSRKINNYDWLLGIFMLMVILFVWIRVFYSKFFAALANALVSFHLSVKLFEERNILLYRVSIVLDFIYIVIFSVFLFEFIEYSGFSGTSIKGIRLFLLLFNILMIYIFLRIIVLRLTGSLFLARSLFSEYLHNTSVINKVMGIALFPVIILAQYLPYKLVPMVLTIGLFVLAAAFIMKAIRAYQIIIRRDILLFYLILYLCTLEILPLLLGYKFVTSLIQSN